MTVLKCVNLVAMLTMLQANVYLTVLLPPTQTPPPIPVSRYVLIITLGNLTLHVSQNVRIPSMATPIIEFANKIAQPLQIFSPKMILQCAFQTVQSLLTVMLTLAITFVWKTVP